MHASLVFAPAEAYLIQKKKNIYIYAKLKAED